MNCSSKDNVLESVELQLQEIEMLQAMFPNQKEIVWHDPTLLLDFEEYKKSNGKISHADLRCLTFQLNLDLSFEVKENELHCCLQVSITLPKLYPRVHPVVSVISNDLTRNEQSRLNLDLNAYINDFEMEQMMLFDIISWLQENTISCYDTCSCVTESMNKATEDGKTLSCMWLYMHHIYNKVKRKHIINWSEELELTGFSLPGKPGVVYVEGLACNVEDYFERLRRLSWKRMTCKARESCNERIFGDFQELCFDVHGNRDYHMDMGKFFMFLKEKKLGHMFKELFGIEGH